MAEVPEQLLEEIRVAHEEIGRIDNTIERAKESILPDDISWDNCRLTALMTKMDVHSMMQTVSKTINKAEDMRREGIMIPNNIITKVRQILPKAREVNGFVRQASIVDNKEEMITLFINALRTVKEMEDMWRIVYDYAKPVPQEAPRIERQRGGRKRRTQRKRTHRKRRRTYRK